MSHHLVRSHTLTKSSLKTVAAAVCCLRCGYAVFAQPLSRAGAFAFYLLIRRVDGGAPTPPPVDFRGPAALQAYAARESGVGSVSVQRHRSTGGDLGSSDHHPCLYDSARPPASTRCPPAPCGRRDRYGRAVTRQYCNNICQKVTSYDRFCSYSRPAIPSVNIGSQRQAHIVSRSEPTSLIGIIHTGTDELIFCDQLTRWSFVGNIWTFPAIRSATNRDKPDQR